MAGRRSESDIPVVAGTALDRRTTLVAVSAAATPILLWVVSFGFSYLVYDFSCAAAGSAAQESPGAGLVATITAVNVVLLLATVAAGVTGALVIARSRRNPAARVLVFLGVVAVALSALVAYSIVLIAGAAFAFEVCA